MTQEKLDILHQLVREIVQLWADGHITDLEFVGHVSDAMLALPDELAVAGLLDPNTGLRYPTLGFATQPNREHDMFTHNERLVRVTVIVLAIIVVLLDLFVWRPL